MKQEFKIGDWVVPVDGKRQYMIGRVFKIHRSKFKVAVQWTIGDYPVVVWPKDILLKISEEQAAIWLLEN